MIFKYVDMFILIPEVLLSVQSMTQKEKNKSDVSFHPQCYKCDSAVDGLEACNDEAANPGELVTCPPQEAKGCYIGEGRWVQHAFSFGLFWFLNNLKAAHLKVVKP